MSDILNGNTSCVIVLVFDDIFLFSSVFTVTIDNCFPCNQSNTSFFVVRPPVLIMYPFYHQQK